jgi:hypothetical protein
MSKMAAEFSAHMALWALTLAALILTIIDWLATRRVAPIVTEISTGALVVGVLLDWAGPDWPRRDPIGVGSVALPGLVLVLAPFAVPQVFPWADVAALALVVTFWIGGRAVWYPWTRSVLRRHSTPESLFQWWLNIYLSRIIEELIAAYDEPARRAKHLRAASAALMKLTVYRAPTSDWAEIRDAYAVLVASIIEGAATPEGLKSGLDRWIVDGDDLKERVEVLSKTA